MRDVASRLGVSEQRVRALLSDGSLEGSKVAGRWFVDPLSVQRREPRHNKRGRPLSAANAWAVLFALSGENLSWLPPWDRSRLKQKLRRSWRQWAPRAQNRARNLRLRAHPGELERLRNDSKIVLGGVSAARYHGIDILARDEVEGYIEPRHLPQLVRRYKLSESSRPNVVLHVVDDVWPFKRGSRVAPIAAVALDLVESEDARSRRAGMKVLDRLSRSSTRHS